MTAQLDTRYPSMLIFDPSSIGQSVKSAAAPVCRRLKRSSNPSA